MSHRYSPRWTFVFILLSVVGFVIQQVTDAWVYFAFFPAFAWEAPWMFLTSIFLHAGVEHLFFNMLALFFFGLALERMIGRRAFALLFLGAGVIGNFGYVLTASDPFTPAIGASGAVYGAMGALAALAPFMLIFTFGLLPLPMIVAAALYALLDLAGLFAPSGIAHGAHLGGLVVGAVVGLYIRRRWHRVP